ncbi:hypothetical protein [Sinorhizobium psoraleae]|uniref:Uncharacterized protein n=1 Tax=Sinorhizobium psoraleae TaxID=520838 RepID=A0ABT4KD78_9HYPH|nr:hypothetical protein [Sinorhizobium psoraleae]MCZ4089906.1 hypothetical protein [Sinorhizobium psoraleae]
MELRIDKKAATALSSTPGSVPPPYFKVWHRWTNGIRLSGAGYHSAGVTGFGAGSPTVRISRHSFSKRSRSDCGILDCGGAGCLFANVCIRFSWFVTVQGCKTISHHKCDVNQWFKSFKRLKNL